MVQVKSAKTGALGLSQLTTTKPQFFGDGHDQSPITGTYSIPAAEPNVVLLRCILKSAGWTLGFYNLRPDFEG